MQEDRCRRAAILLLLREIEVELVGRELHAEREIGRLFRREGSLRAHEHEARIAALGELGEGLATEAHRIRRGALLVAIQADEHDMRGFVAEARLGRQRQARTALPLEFLRLHHRREAFCRRFADQGCDFGRDAGSACEEAEHGAGWLLGQGNKGDGRALGHEILV